MKQPFFVGIDGGATKTIIRVEDTNGKLLAEKITGPANIRISPAQAWQSIAEGLEMIFSPLGISLGNPPDLRAVIGLAGCEMVEAQQAFLPLASIFSHLDVLPDSQAACLAAHQGQDGAIIIIGTGTVGFQLEQGHMTRVGGWGFPHDDEGGGAWLGLMAIRHTCYVLDNREKPSLLSKTVLQHFHSQTETFVTWANQANSSVFAQLAPLVIESAALGDAVAIALLQQAAKHIDAIFFALRQKTNTTLPVALIGGIASFVEPYLDKTLQQRLRVPLMTPAQGAAWLARKQWGAANFG